MVLGGQPIAEIEMDPDLEKELEYGASNALDVAAEDKLGQNFHGQPIRVSNITHYDGGQKNGGEEPGNLAINTISMMN